MFQLGLRDAWGNWNTEISGQTLLHFTAIWNEQSVCLP